MVGPERLESMQSAWIRLLESFKIEASAAYPVFDLLVAAYSAPERRYHNLEHLHEMFRTAGRLTCNDPASVQLAIWFHDAVYDSRASDNEPRSADLSVDLLGPIGVPASTLEKVVRLIRATAHTDGSLPPGDNDTATVLDADLAILGAAPERYAQYARDIRQEYAWVPEEKYRVGRAAVLQKFLARPRIYHHALIFGEGENQARVNLAAELSELTR